MVDIQRLASEEQVNTAAHHQYAHSKNELHCILGPCPTPQAIIYHTSHEILTLE